MQLSVTTKVMAALEMASLEGAVKPEMGQLQAAAWLPDSRNQDHCTTSACAPQLL
jgi:hypothetical protein